MQFYIHSKYFGALFIEVTKEFDCNLRFVIEKFNHELIINVPYGQVVFTPPNAKETKDKTTIDNHYDVQQYSPTSLPKNTNHFTALPKHRNRIPTTIRHLPTGNRTKRGPLTHSPSGANKHATFNGLPDHRSPLKPSAKRHTL